MEITIETYKTKGFSNEGVIGSTPVADLNAPVDAITSDVMNLPNVPTELIVHNPVKVLPTGNGTDGDMPVDNLGAGTKSAGMVGANNSNHS